MTESNISRNKIICPACTSEHRLVDPEAPEEVLGEFTSNAVLIKRYNKAGTLSYGPFVVYACANHKGPVFTVGNKMATSRLNFLSLFIGHTYSTSGIKDFLRDFLELGVYSVDDLTQVLKEISTEGKNENTA